jgi:hypothetical protein
MKRVYLYLINKGEYQLSLQRSAEKAAQQLGFHLEVFLLSVPFRPQCENG